MMKANLLPLRHGFIYSLKNLIRGRASVHKPVNLDSGELILDIESIEHTAPCDNQRINGLFKKLKVYEYGVSAFLHGSWADDTCTPFSDIDDLIVLNLESLNQQGDLKKVLTVLNAIDMSFCRIDPIQHHGHWIISKDELKNYDNSFMPVHVLKDAKHILGEDAVVARVNTEVSLLGLKKNVINTCKAIEELAPLYFNGTINAYQLKGLAGCFVLMPAFIYQVLGKKLTKPEAIAKAGGIYSERALNCIRWSGESRLNWSVITESRSYKRFSLLTHVFSNPHLWRRFAKKYSPKVSSEQKERLCEFELEQSAVEVFIKESLKYGQ